MAGENVEGDKGQGTAIVEASLYTDINLLISILSAVGGWRKRGRQEPTLA